MLDESLDFEGEEQPTPPPEPRDLSRTPVAVTQALAIAKRERQRDVGSITVAGATLTVESKGGDVLAEATIPGATPERAGAMSAADKAALDALAARPWPEAPLNLKGIVSTLSELPAESNKSGDMYIVGVSSPYEEYFWTGGAWEMLGMFPAEIDTSGFLLKSDFLPDSTFIEEVTSNG